MIQRVQTIFLFLITVAMGIALTNPLWEKAGKTSPEMAHLTALQYTTQQAVTAQPGLPAQTLPTTYVDSVWYLALPIA
ncbi:MAG: DUF4293 family protein, partial [Cytophagaceae bacterium]